MAASNDLEVRIKGDIADLEAKLSQAKKAMISYLNEVERVSGKFNKSAGLAERLRKRLDNLNNEYKQGGMLQSTYTQASERLQQRIAKADQETLKYSRQLNKLQREQKQTENTTEKLNAELASTSGATQQAAGATKTFGAGMSTMNNTVRGTTPTLTSFSQVIQDAPYGIRGVANNIQQLTAQFGYMSQQAGGARNAFKSLLAGLTGPAGILLAVSVVTSAFIQYGDEIKAFIQNTSDAVKAQRELNKAMNDGLSGAKVTALQIETLVSAIQDQNSSMEVQKNAYDELSEVAPELTENYSLQQIAAGKAKQSIDELTQSLFSQAKVQGALSVLEEKFGKISEKANKARETASSFVLTALSKENSYIRHQIKDREALLKINKNDVKFQKQAAGQIKTEIEELRSQLTEAGQIARKESFIQDYVKEETEGAIKELESFKETYKQLLGESLEITPPKERGSGQKSKKSFGLSGIDIDIFNSKEADAELSEISSFAEKLQELYPFLQTQRQIDTGLTDEINDAYSDILRFEELVKNLQKTLGEGFTGAGFDIPELESLQVRLENAQEIANIAASSIQQAFSAMSSSLVKSLGLGEDALGSFVGSVISSTISVIAAKLAEALAGAILAAVNAGGQTGVAAPVTIPAFIAGLTGGVAAAFSSIPTFAQGGIVPGGSFNGDKVPAYLNSGEMILNGGQQNQLFKMLDMRMGGVNANHEPIKVQVYGQIRGENIELASDRYNKRRGRIN